MSDMLHLWIGSERFTARLRRDLAPRSCGRLVELLPYAGKLIHAHWSGEALWAPLASAVPRDLVLPREHATTVPSPGQLLFYAGERSMPELYVPYGVNRFACKDGPLEGNPVLSITDGLQLFAELGSEALCKGALDLRIEVSP